MNKTSEKDIDKIWSDVEDLKANEGSTSTSEDLTSINDELTSINEDLTSINEDLTSINDELSQTNLDIEQAQQDIVVLQNAPPPATSGVKMDAIGYSGYGGFGTIVANPIPPGFISKLAGQDYSTDNGVAHGDNSGTFTKLVFDVAGPFTAQGITYIDYKDYPLRIDQYSASGVLKKEGILQQRIAHFAGMAAIGDYIVLWQGTYFQEWYTPTCELLVQAFEA